MLFHEEICTIIRAEESLHSLRNQCIRDALIGNETDAERAHLLAESARVARACEEPTQLSRLLIAEMWDARGWR